MFRASVFALIGGLVLLSGGFSQEPKKDDPKKDDPAVKAKGMLPNNWKKLGLTDAQVQDVYKIQGKYNGEIDKLEAKIAELKATRDKELKTVLTPEQKKRLEEILIGKDK
jgi:Spy/CpxP family protein refolding chaperone